MRRSSNARRNSVLSKDSSVRSTGREFMGKNRRGSVMSRGSGISTRSKPAGEDSSIPIEWLIGTDAYEKPLYEPVQEPQQLIPTRSEIGKSIAVRRTLRAAKKQEKNDIELLGIGGFTTMTNNAPSRAESRGSPHPVTPRLFSSSTLISQAAELHEAKERQREDNRMSLSAQFQKKRSSIAAYRFLLANSPSKESMKQGATSKVFPTSPEYPEDVNHQNHGKKANQTSVSETLSSEFSALFHPELSMSQERPMEERSKEVYPQLSPSSSKLSKISYLSKQTVSEWAAQGLEATDLFSDSIQFKPTPQKRTQKPSMKTSNKLQTSKTTPDVQNGAIPPPPTSSSLSAEDFLEYIKSQEGVELELSQCGSTMDDEDVSIDTNLLPGNIQYSYLNDFDNRSPKSVQSSTASYVDGSNPIVQRFRVETFPPENSGVKRTRGSFVFSTKPGVHGKKTMELSPVVYEKNFRVVRDEDNDPDQNYGNLQNYKLIKSYRPPLMRPPKPSVRDPEQPVSQEKKNIDQVDSISAFLSGYASKDKDAPVPSPSKHQQQHLCYNDQGFIAHLKPISQDTGGEGKQVSMMNNVRVEASGEYLSQVRSRQSSPSNRPSISQTLVTPADLLSPTRMHPMVAFGSRAHCTPGLQVSTSNKPLEENSISQSSVAPDSVKGEVAGEGSRDLEIDNNGVWHMSYGKLKPLQGDSSNLSLEEAASFADSYKEWMVAEVNSPLPVLSPTPPSPQLEVDTGNSGDILAVRIAGNNVLTGTSNQEEAGMSDHRMESLEAVDASVPGSQNKLELPSLITQAEDDALKQLVDNPYSEELGEGLEPQEDNKGIVPIAPLSSSRPKKRNERLMKRK